MYPWLLENYSDFDLFIDDDTPEKMLGVIEEFRDNKYYAMPAYKCNENVQGENVYRVEVNISNLESKEFVMENKAVVKQQ